jgi:hypothetical protein
MLDTSCSNSTSAAVRYDTLFHAKDASLNTACCHKFRIVGGFHLAVRLRAQVVQ